MKNRETASLRLGRSFVRSFVCLPGWISDATVGKREPASPLRERRERETKKKLRGGGKDVVRESGGMASE